jgi:hypothetical protein
MRNSLADHKEKGVFLFWHKIRSRLMFGIAFIASPCCAPLFVPLVVALSAGTPISIWLSYHTGWVYGGLTLVSIISLVLGLRFARWKKLANNAPLLLLSRRISKLLEVSKKKLRTDRRKANVEGF